MVPKIIVIAKYIIGEDDLKYFDKMVTTFIDEKSPLDKSPASPKEKLRRPPPGSP
jgi:hypothetical protein